MRTLLFFLFCCPSLLWAQADTLTPQLRNDLKPIGNDLLPGYYGRYGNTVRTQYTYDGLDIRHAKELGQYIYASGNPEAIHEFNRYIGSRKAGGWLIAGGLLSAIVGVAVMSSNAPDSDGKFHTTQPITCPKGYFCSGATTMSVVDTPRQDAYSAGATFMLGGLTIAGIGWGLNIPGQHVRRAVQYYNRSLKQRGISWQLKPYSSTAATGLGLTGRF